MSTPFSSLNTALSALRYQQAALDVASSNVANVSTDGYVRRRVVGQTVAAGAVPALWSRSNEVGSGVQAAGVQRLTDALLDARVRQEHGRQAYLDSKSATMARIETGLAEPGSSGVAAALATFKSALHDLNNAADSDAARTQVLSAAAKVADAVRLQERHLTDEASDQRARVLADVDEVNSVTAQLASTNHMIASASAGSADTSTLMDTRDALVLRLSELTGATATQRPDGGMDVTLGGVSLVSGSTAAELRITGGVAADGSATGGPVTFAVGATADPVTLPAGDLAASVEVLDVVIPGYVAGLDDVARMLADQVNTQQAAGYDASGASGAPIFGYDPDHPASALTVVMTDPSGLAASSVAGGVVDGGNALAIADAITVADPYQRLVNGFGSQVSAVQGLAANQQALTNQVDSAREQLTGVSLDEETVNMVAAQHAYEAAARVMSTIDSILDTLINRTGVN